MKQSETKDHAALAEAFINKDEEHVNWHEEPKESFGGSKMQ